MSLRPPPIPAPCAADWAAMPGGAATRHCAACDRPVHDLSEQTDAEAAAILTTPGACVRVAVVGDELLTRSTRYRMLLTLLSRHAGA